MRSLAIPYAKVSSQTRIPFATRCSPQEEGVRKTCREGHAFERFRASPAFHPLSSIQCANIFLDDCSICASCYDFVYNRFQKWFGQLIQILVLEMFMLGFEMKNKLRFQVWMSTTLMTWAQMERCLRSPIEKLGQGSLLRFSS